MKEEIRIEGDKPEKHEIEVKPITLICTHPDFNSNIVYPDRFSITPVATVEHARKVQELHPRAAGLIAMVFGVKASEVTPDWSRRQGMGVQHVTGLVDLTLKLAVMGVPVVWKHPESFLHPRAQCQLADVLIDLMNNPPESLRAAQNKEDILILEKLSKEILGDG